LSLITMLTVLASVDATCPDDIAACSSAPVQGSLLLQMGHTNRWRDTTHEPNLLQQKNLTVDAQGNLLLQMGHANRWRNTTHEPNLLQEMDLTVDAASQCADLDGNCRYYTSYCGTDNIKRQCRKTCGLCGNAGCVDLDGNCQYYTQYCGTDNINRQCRKTCGLCGSAPITGGSTKIKVVSYNLFWWNAFQQNPSKGSDIIANIKGMQADVLGLQECNNAGSVTSRTGNMYNAVSSFSDNQGVMTKPGVFSVLSQGSRDLQARGKWGNRYVNWVKLRHLSSGRSFWVFNTHWCVASGNGYTCNGGVRQAGAKNMLRAIREVAGTTSPVVITGDFNAGMGEPGIQEFLRNGFALARNSGVDAIFYSQSHWSVAAARTGSASGSDHSPVIVDLQLTR